MARWQAGILLCLSGFAIGTVLGGVSRMLASQGL